MIKTLTPVIAILAIGALMAYAISQGINGALLSGAVAIMAGLGGWTARGKIVK